MEISTITSIPITTSKPTPITILVQLVRTHAMNLVELPERRDRPNSKLPSKDSTSGESLKWVL